MKSKNTFRGLIFVLMVGVLTSCFLYIGIDLQKDNNERTFNEGYEEGKNDCVKAVVTDLVNYASRCQPFVLTIPIGNQSEGISQSKEFIFHEERCLIRGADGKETN